MIQFLRQVSVPFINVQKELVMERRIIIDVCKNFAMRSYHVNWLMSHHPVKNFSFPIPSYEKKDLAGCGSVGAGLISRLSEFDGVVEIFLKSYGCSIIRGDAFKWSEVEQKVIAALVATLPEEEQSSVVVAYGGVRVPCNQDSLEI